MSSLTSLPRPLLLADGRCLRTIVDAGNMVLGLTPEEKAQPRWQAVTNNLISAINSGRSDQAHVIAWQLERALTEPPLGSVRLAPAVAPARAPLAHRFGAIASSEFLSLLAVGMITGVIVLGLR